MVSETSSCPVCLLESDTPALWEGDILRVRCPRCGDFRCVRGAAHLLREQVEKTEEGKPRLGPSGSRHRANASAYVRENRPDRITTTDIERLARQRTPTFHERADKLLLGLDRATDDVGQTVKITDPKWLAVAWCRNQAELFELVFDLRDLGRLGLEKEKDWSSVAIKPSGWDHLETLRARGAASSQGFIAMHMTESLDSLWHGGLEAGIEAAGYRALRIDRKLDAVKLDDEILAEIKRSKFLVADLTDQRQSVYLEIGFAMGLGMPVFRTCCEDDIPNLHFDQKTYHCTPWVQGKEDELAKPLRDRIVAKVGWGPLKSSE